MIERLTQGEQVIYAAVFAAEVAPLFKPGGVPLHIIEAGTEDEWRKRQAVSAAEVAWATIEAFREAGSGIVEGFGGASDVMRLWQMMRGY